MVTNMQQWEQELDSLTREYREAFESLSPQQLNTRPQSTSWSIGQIISHVIQVNETYYPIFNQLEAGTYSPPFHGQFGGLVRMFGNLILNSVEPSRKKKSKTLPLWEPATVPVADDLLLQFSAHQEALLAHLNRCEKYASAGAVIHSPASKAIVYRLDKAIEIILTHERRHLNQALEVKALLTQ